MKRLFLIFFTILTLWGCQTKVYHDITAHYNGYFNARERLRNSLLTLNRSHIDDYNKILSVYQYGDEAKSKAIQPDMDEVMKKSSVVIQKHGKSRWVDESFFLVGQTHFFKRDYYSAIEVFQYINTKYKNSNMSKLATVWIMKSYLMMDKVPEAQSVFTSLKNESTMPDKETYFEYYSASAELFIRQGDDKNAIKYLRLALGEANRRWIKIRYRFILGQLYQRSGRIPMAIDAYKKVIKMNPVYDMAFNAKLNIGRLYDAKNPESIKQAKSYLRSMLKDDKNLAYLDQIYYELGNISMVENKIETAEKNYKLGLIYSTQNQNQKSLLYLKLAELYFNKPEYALSKLYYDSTAMFLDKRFFPDFDKVIAKKGVLSKLIANLEVIRREDSLQRLAKMDKAELEKLIDKAIAEKKENEKKKAGTNQQQENFFPDQDPNPNPNNASAGAGDDWYFYNPSAIGVGFAEFVKRWGERANEDNWRISSKAKGNTDKNDGSDNPNDKGDDKGDNATAKDKDTKEDRAAYYKNIPTTASALEASNNRIINAYVSNGLIYKEQLQDLKEAVRILESLLQRYPENSYLSKVYYYLYRSYEELKNAEKAEYYKNLLLEKFPNSEYAGIIKNTYTKTTGNGSNDAEIAYTEAYEDYKKGNYQAVKQKCASALAKFPKSNIIPKFEYLNALAIGKTDGEDKLKLALEDIVKKYPNTDVYVAAQNILDYIKRKNSGTLVDYTATTESYTYNATAEHYYIITTANTADLEIVKTGVLDYNSEYHRLESFTVSTYVLNDETKILVVKSFKDEKSATTYYREFINNLLFFEKVGLEEYSQFIISVDNFKLLMRTKSEEEYISFFQEKYE